MVGSTTLKTIIFLDHKPLVNKLAASAKKYAYLSSTQTPPSFAFNYTVLKLTNPPRHILSVVFQDFNINVPRETYGILGNDAIIKCEVPSFVADLVSVTGWTDSFGNNIPRTFGK